MHGQGGTGWNYRKRHGATWTAVGGYGYFGPGRVAMDEQLERVMIEAAHRRLLMPPNPTGRRIALQTPGQFLGDPLQRASARIRQILTYAGAIAALRKSA